MNHESILISDILKVNNLMVEIPSGKIEMRDDRTKQKWVVEIEAFLLCKFLVTQKLYFQVLNESPSTFTGENLPVETISWKEAVTFCNSLSAINRLNTCYIFDNENDEIIFKTEADGFRLPTEAEWEYACKAGTSGIRYGGIDAVAWYRENSGKSTQFVGTKEPNLFGIYDMLGNVWEWCSDIYDETVYGSYRIIRGGGWNDEARGCMATNRRRSHPLLFKIDDLGFRVARNIKR